MSSKEHKQLIWKLIEDIGVGMLTTLDGNDLRGRPMHLVQKEYDGTLWFYTAKDAAKVYEAKQDHHVGLTFSKPSGDVYVSLSGTAKLSDDVALKKKLWSPFVAAWFSGGPESDEVRLLEVKIHKGEHWKTDKNKVLQLVEIGKANLTDSAPDMGENRKFG